MSLEKASIVWSAKQLSGMVKNGKINFEHIIQRSFVWERTRKSALIESMILGYPIPAVFAKRMDDGTGKRGSNTYFIMDGKQRLSTVKEFLNDEFALSKLKPVTYFDSEEDKEVEIDISEKKFSELPDGLKDFLNTVTFSVTYFDNLTKDEEKELFSILKQAGISVDWDARKLVIIDYTKQNISKVLAHQDEWNGDNIPIRYLEDELTTHLGYNVYEIDEFIGEAAHELALRQTADNEGYKIPGR